jgi:hypothetical protein
MKHFKINAKIGIFLIVFLLGNTLAYSTRFQGWNMWKEDWQTITMPYPTPDIKCEYFDYRANKNHTTKDWAFVVVSDLHGRTTILDSILRWTKRNKSYFDIRFVILLGDICDKGHGAINGNYWEANKNTVYSSRAAEFQKGPVNFWEIDTLIGLTNAGAKTKWKIPIIPVMGNQNSA